MRAECKSKDPFNAGMEIPIQAFSQRVWTESSRLQLRNKCYWGPSHFRKSRTGTFGDPALQAKERNRIETARSFVPTAGAQDGSGMRLCSASGLSDGVGLGITTPLKLETGNSKFNPCESQSLRDRLRAAAAAHLCRCSRLPWSDGRIPPWQVRSPSQYLRDCCEHRR